MWAWEKEKSLEEKELSPQEKWEKATIADNFLFCKIMESEPDLCKELIEMLLHIKIAKLEIPQSEKTMKETFGSRGVRFDVYTQGDNKIFDIELQTANEGDLPKRARYYQGVIDVDNLPEGVDHKKLKDSYVIFLCLFDLFKQEMPVYTFENVCIENNMVKLNDRAYKVFFNAKNCDKLKNDEEKSFFKFLQGESAKSNFTKNLSEKVARAKQNIQWRTMYMTWEQSIAYEGQKRAEKLAPKLAEKLAEELAKNKQFENAKNLLKMNVLSVEQISEALGLSLEDVNKIKQEI